MAKSDLELRIGISSDPKQPYIVRLYDVDGDEKKIAYSETYTQKAGARNMAEAVIDGRYQYEVFQGTDGNWYWRLRSTNGERLARSNFHYDSSSKAGWREDWLEEHRKDAVIVDLT